MARNEFACDCNVIHQDLVESTQKQMVDEDILNKMADFFSILGDTTRVKILDALDKNELCVCDIANVLGMSKSSISHQLGTLRRMNIKKNDLCYRKSETGNFALPIPSLILSVKRCPDV